MKRNLVRQCIKCGNIFGEKEPYSDRSVTTGYCPKCFKEEMEKLERKIKAKEGGNPMARRITRKQCEDYINETGIPNHDHPDYGGRVSKGWVTRHGEYSYGTWLKEHDPIAFQLACEDIRKFLSNPPDFLEAEFRKFDKSPSKYMSHLGIDPAQFPGINDLRYQLTYTEKEAENVYNEDDTAALIVKKVARKLGV